MNKNTFNLGVVLLLFGQLLAQIISGLSNELIPASLLLISATFFLILAHRTFNTVLILPTFKRKDSLYFLLIGGFIFSAYFYGKGISTDQKVVGTLYLILLPWIILFFLSLSISKINIEKFAKTARSLAIVTITLAFIMFFLGFTSSIIGSHKITIIGVGNTIWFGRYLGLLIVVLIITSNKKNILITFIFIFIAAYLLLASGARGPLVAILSAIIYMRFKIKPIYAMLSLISLIILPGIIDVTAIADFLLNRNDFSNYSRVQLLKISFDLIKTHPITGIGFGNFGSYSFAFDDSINFYPHNILVEVFVECGVFSFVTLILLIINTFYIGKNNHFFLTIFVYLFVNSLFSGDITGNSILFTSMFLIRLLSDKKIINSPKERGFTHDTPQNGIVNTNNKVR